jgi:hypothetical protein
MDHIPYLALDVAARAIFPIAQKLMISESVVGREQDSSQAQFLAALQIAGQDESGHIEIAFGDRLETGIGAFDKRLGPAVIRVPGEDGKEIGFRNVAEGEIGALGVSGGGGEETADGCKERKECGGFNHGCHG